MQTLHFTLCTFVVTIFTPWIQMFTSTFTTAQSPGHRLSGVGEWKTTQGAFLNTVVVLEVYSLVEYILSVYWDPSPDKRKKENWAKAQSLLHPSDSDSSCQVRPQEFAWSVAVLADSGVGMKRYSSFTGHRIECLDGLEVPILTNTPSLATH
jgi:hypothetical protein